ADGGAGNDTYHYAKDAGRLYLSGETASSGSADRIVFSDLTLDDFIFDTLDYGPLPYGGDQVALRMLWNDGESSGELRVADMAQHIESFEFADGTEMQIEDLSLLF
ncbi:hypothetical protein SAMN05421759_1383, partial [Roseivivax lentus]